MTELKIERTGPRHDAGVQITLTVPWVEMEHPTMGDMRNDGAEVDAVLIAGAVPALVRQVASEHPWALHGPLYILLDEARDKARRAGQMDSALFTKLAVAQRLLNELNRASFPERSGR